MSLTGEEKIEIATSRKEAGDEAFKKGDLQTALRNYHEALLYLNGIDKSAMPGALVGSDVPVAGEENKPKGPIDEMLEKIYANQAACHIKKENWKRAIEAADKALNKNKDNHKALFRKAKANAELGFVERATKLLNELREKTTDEKERELVDNELKRIQREDADRQRKHDTSLRGFLTRKKDGESSESAATPATSSD